MNRPPGPPFGLSSAGLAGQSARSALEEPAPLVSATSASSVRALAATSILIPPQSTRGPYSFVGAGVVKALHMAENGVLGRRVTFRPPAGPQAGKCT